MKNILRYSIVFFFISTTTSYSQHVPLGQEKLVALLDQELSGESAKRNLEYISRLHRMRGSDDYNKAIAFILSKLSEYNLEGIEIIKIPANGQLMYGTEKSRPAWNASFAELWEQKPENGQWVNHEKIADWESIPMVLAQDSKSGEVSTELVDIGAGTSESVYQYKDVKGKLVLTSSQPGAVAPLAIEKYGAAGVISYAQNQPSAWHGENENLIRWGHFEYFDNTNSFGFMVSLKQARAFQKRLAAGEKIQLYAKVIADTEATDWQLLTAVIEGSDPSLSGEEILYTCHLDHPRPGANDNASGCVAILEVARTIKKLIDEGKLERPKRTLRFLWSPEIEGTNSLLGFKPELAAKTKFNIHMDMVGGGLETKGIYQISRGPKSLPSFINDIGEAFGEFLNQSSIAYTSGDAVNYPMVSQEGGKEPFHAILGNFHMGSDFEVFTEGTYRIPSIYLHQYPDRYIHTNYDLPAFIDPTVLKRSSFIGAVSGVYLADFGSENLEFLTSLMKKQVLSRSYQMLQFADALPVEEAENVKYYFWLQEMEAFQSLEPYVSLSESQMEDYRSYLEQLKGVVGAGTPVETTEPNASLIYYRNPEIKGGMFAFGYDYFTDNFGKEKPRPQLFTYKGIRGTGSEYTYETLNLVNGKNSISDIRNILSAEFGPVPLSLVQSYLEALESIKVIFKNPVKIEKK
ncbi:M28 family peptidase [Algoriphagus lutimaris]|uniref:M28 family peptidase n=1 Tax=Algoriphagus lutimaris TaxID=613197 RepID=UPI00196B2B22|nr:M28 family peptidase [Algoriphagus lutimaris]MBN3522027.1 M28 family peptidase [Algoriphagus lutimaris]